MIFGSVCSGIEAASLAWEPLGWRAAFLSEIEKFPRAVLRHRWPAVPLHGDFTTIKAGDYEPIDLLAGGTPCQSFSVAGKRAGLDDPRGNLTLEYLALARRLGPRWLVWENVPGILSDDEGRTFGAVLRALVDLGYGFAYRVLDAQWFGVPQRRRRVFLVGYLGDWRPAAAVLFESEGLRGDPPPRRETGKGIAPTISARPTGGGGLGTDFDLDGGLIAHTLRGEGFDASEDGTGRGTPIVPVAYGGNNTAGPIDVATAVNAHGGPHGRLDFESETFVAFDTTQITSPQNRNNPLPGDPCHPLTSGGHPPALAFSCKDHGATAEVGGEQATALRASSGGGDKAHVLTTSAVRRLTPKETERLQGMPDDHTRIPWRGKPAEQCPDGPRYKAIGNSWAVPCAAWIGKRIEAVDKIMKEPR